MENDVLSADRVREIMKDCLLEEKDASSKEAIVISSGILHKAILSKSVLEKHKDEIFKMLLELPDQFMQSKGGGWMFLNACMDKQNRHWGEHFEMESLFMLGMGIGKVKLLVPLKAQSYFVVLD